MGKFKKWYKITPITWECPVIKLFKIGSGWYEHRKYQYKNGNSNIYSSIFMKQHSWKDIKFWIRSYQKSIMDNMEYNIQKIIIMLWLE